MVSRHRPIDSPPAGLQHGRSDLPRAFTLIEVLVVVAIMALLITILLPSLKRARQQAQKAACASNLHQMGMGMVFYTETFRRYPAHHTLSGYAVWPVRLLPFIGSPNARRIAGPAAAEVYWCPSAPERSRWDGKKKLRTNNKFGAPVADEHRSFAYGYNDWGQWERASDRYPLLGLGAWEVSPNDTGNLAKQGVPPSRVERPAEMFAIADSDTDEENIEKYQGWDNWDTTIDPYEKEEWPGDRHLKTANVLCVDAHVESILREKMVVDGIKKNIRMLQRWNNDFRYWKDATTLGP